MTPDDTPRYDEWGGETRADRILTAFANLEAALAARYGHTTKPSNTQHQQGDTP